MGDVAMTVPAVEGLRNAHPDVKITVVTRGFFRPFFRDVQDINFLDFDAKGRHKGFLGIFRLMRDILNTGAGAIADLHDVLRTKIVRRLLWLCGRRVSTIKKGRNEKKMLTRRHRKLMSPIMPMTERYRMVMIKLGFFFNMPDRYQHIRRTMPKAISEQAGEKTGIWVGVAPFAKHKGKIYPIPLADKLIELLSQKYEHVFVFGGGDYEKGFAEGMEVRHNGVISVIGRVTLTEEMDVISNLDAIVTMDSSASHLASLVGTPAVSVWGATHPYVGFYGFGQDPENAVQLSLPCRPCSVYGNKPCIFGDYRCLADIEPEMIADAVARAIKADETREQQKEEQPEAGYM